MYKQLIIELPLGGTTTHIIRDNGNEQYTSFPADENNPYYQAYLKWLAEGNVPTPADEVTQ
jgi:hypothetical protein